MEESNTPQNEHPAPPDHELDERLARLVAEIEASTFEQRSAMIGDMLGYLCGAVMEQRRICRNHAMETLLDRYDAKLEHFRGKHPSH